MHDPPQFWLLILLTAAYIFSAGSMIHRVFKWHTVATKS